MSGHAFLLAAGQTVIERHPALRERELLKLASLSSAVAAALRGRGIPEPAAILAASTAVTVFTVAFGQCSTDGETRPPVEIEGEVMRDVAAITSDGPLTR